MRNGPAIKRPKVNSVADQFSDVSQPWDPGMGRFRDLALDVKMKVRFGLGALFAQSSPAAVAYSGCAIPNRSIPDEINVNVVAIRRPMSLEIIQKRRPIRRDSMKLEIPQGK
ncbi:conserved protein of unknown function [Magnetospirillum sp. XM-1]|nr:conserved protein of unknown function [Magnetospirillum sp. XM-1]